MAQLKHYTTDPVQPISTINPVGSFLASYRGAKKEKKENEIRDLKLENYKRQSDQDAVAGKVKSRMMKLGQDKEFIEMGKASLSRIDPDASNFDEQVVKAGLSLEKSLVERYDFSPEESRFLLKHIITTGGFGREEIRRRRIEAGLQAPESKAKTQIVGDQLVTTKDGEATASEIRGLRKKTDPKTKLGKLIKERDSLPKNSPDKALFDQAILKEARGQKGQDLTVDPDGTVHFSQGGQGSGLGRAATNQLQKDMVDSSTMLVRLNDIEKSYNEGYLTAAGKFDMTRLTLLQKIAPGMMDKDDKETVKEASEFYTNALTNLNMTLNELSGAAVSVQEFKRISQALPNPGKKGFLNILSGDSITDFKTKLDVAIKRSKMAVARLNYVDKNGFTIGKNRKGDLTGFFDTDGKMITLSNMPKIMDERANEIGERMLAENPEMSVDEVRGIVSDKIAQEFGMVVE